MLFERESFCKNVLRTLVIFLVFCFDLFLECLLELEPSAGRRGSNVLIVALYELATGDVIRDLLRLPKLPGVPGQGLLACRHYLERESV